MASNFNSNPHRGVVAGEYFHRAFRNYIDPFFMKYRPIYGDGELYISNEDYDVMHRNMEHLCSLEAEHEDELGMVARTPWVEVPTCLHPEWDFN